MQGDGHSLLQRLMCYKYFGLEFLTEQNVLII